MHNAIHILYSEQEYLYKAINKCIAFKNNVEDINHIDKNGLSELIDFFNIYSDLYHHAKEEKLLIPFLIEKNSKFSNAAFALLVDDHKILKEVLNDLDREVANTNPQKIISHLEEYVLLLTDHIHLEIVALLHALESNFDHGELQLLEDGFINFDKSIGLSTKKYFEKIIG